MEVSSCMVDLHEIIEDEVLIIKHSGEIPEIAFHGALYYLGEDPEGPGLDVSNDLIAPLVTAVVERYRFITLRDLNPKNRDKRIYRGIARSIVNWRRLAAFAEKHGVELSAFRQDVADHLRRFLERELEDVSTGRRTSCINANLKEISDFAREVSLEISGFEAGLRDICPVEKGCY